MFHNFHAFSSHTLSFILIGYIFRRYSGFISFHYCSIILHVLYFFCGCIYRDLTQRIVVSVIFIVAQLNKSFSADYYFAVRFLPRLSKYMRYIANSFLYIHISLSLALRLDLFNSCVSSVLDV